MLKKAGIVVAAAAAGLLAVTPLAFASDTDQHGKWNSNNETHQHPVQACDNHIGILDGAFAGGLKSEAKNKQVNSGDCSQDNSSEN